MTPGLIVLIFVAVFFACVLFPFAWLALGFWQTQQGLKPLAVLSLLVALGPFGLYWLFFHSGNPTFAFVSLLLFIPVNAALLLASFFVSRIRIRSQSTAKTPTTSAQ